MDKKEELLERLVNEFAAYNRLTAVRIAKENLFSWGKSDEEIVKEMKSSSERILKWGYSTDEDFPLDPPKTTTVKIHHAQKTCLSNVSLLKNMIYPQHVHSILILAFDISILSK